MMRQYPVGEPINFVGKFTDPITDQPRNPNSVVLRLMSPSGLEARPGVVNPTVGTYTASYTPTEAGIWYVRWDGVGGMKAIMTYQFEATPSKFAPLT